MGNAGNMGNSLAMTAFQGVTYIFLLR